MAYVVSTNAVVALLTCMPIVLWLTPDSAALTYLRVLRVLRALRIFRLLASARRGLHTAPHVAAGVCSLRAWIYVWHACVCAECACLQYFDAMGSVRVRMRAVHACVWYALVWHVTPTLGHA
jgi:hypothetical protein